MSSHRRRTHPNDFVISPHSAVLTQGALDNIVELVIDNVERFCDGRPLHNVVDKTLGYVG